MIFLKSDCPKFNFFLCVIFFEFLFLKAKIQIYDNYILICLFTCFVVEHIVKSYLPNKCNEDIVFIIKDILIYLSGILH